jgi:epidermal growth factor receptor substrate 15
MAFQGFSPSVKELELATRLLETNIWQSDILSIDSAIGIFKQSDITLKQLRDIWTIADKKGSGSLSKNELAVVIRLMGWVQSGEPLREGLLTTGMYHIPLMILRRLSAA